MKRSFGMATVASILAFGCNVSDAPKSTGGVQFPEADAGATATPDAGVPEGASPDASAPTASCDRGVVIVMSDYVSTNIAVAGLDGTTKSGSFVSSGATKPGLALALSGDVDVPAAAPASKRVVLIDRYGTNVLTWMDLASASVLGQLPIGTGFESNPHDYLEVDATRAFISRYGSNLAPGKQPFDQGGDLLIVDTTTRTITGRIAMPEENADLTPCPDGMSKLGTEVVVSLGRWSNDFTKVGDGRFVGVSPTTNKVDWQVDVTGLRACGRLAVSPSGKLAAIACSSKMDANGKFDATASDIVVYDATVTPPKELRRLGLGAKLGAAVQPTITFASDDAIFALAYAGGTATGDSVLVVSASTGAATTLAQATKSYVFGGTHCAPGCGNVCLLADAERNKLRRWTVGTDGSFTAMDDVVVETVVGLPPRSIGSL